MRLSVLAASIISIVLSFSWIPAAWSQKGAEPSVPIQIEADRMESSRENGAVLFFGNVTASQGNLKIQADEMTVVYGKTASGPDASAEPAADLSRKIETIRAKGHVKIVQDDWIGAGDTMNFDAEKRIVSLIGNASAWQDQNTVSGEKIILYLNEGKSVVESSSGEGERVKAFIYPSARNKEGEKDQ